LKKLFLTFVFSAILLSSVISFPPAHALNLSEIIKIVASDDAANDEFGFLHISISGDTAIVGASGGFSLPFIPGAAYIFEKVGGTWTQVAKLTASDAAVGDQFGFSVSISGDTAIVGAFDAGLGAAYVFVKLGGGWADATQDAKLTASDGFLSAQFGNAVSIDGDTAIVGARVDNHGGAISSAGAAYIFEKPGGGWIDATQDAKLTASDATAGDQLGNSVSISGNTALVGARLDNIGGTGSGSAYIFEKPGGGWIDATQDAKLTASDSAQNDDFGFASSISGDTALVGAFRTDDDGNRSGSAYVFVKPGGGWVDATQDAILKASDAAAEDQFAWAVSISGNTILVGAFGDDSNAGSAYVFMKPGGGWVDATEDQKLTASDAAAGDEFGDSVSISGNTAIIGAHFNDDGGNDSGSAYIFETVSLPVGGEMIPLDSTMILVAGAQYNAAWMIPALVSAIGIGIVLARKF